MAALRKELQDQMGKKNRKDLDAAAAKVFEFADLRWNYFLCFNGTK